MIRKLLLLITFMVPMIGWANSWEDLVHRNGLLYERFSDNPFSGNFTGQFQGELKGGVFEGEWRFFLPQGQLALKINFERGVPVGEFEAYDESGNLLERSDVGNSWKGMAEFFEEVSKLWDQDVYESEHYYWERQKELRRLRDLRQSEPENIERYVNAIRDEILSNWSWGGESDGLAVYYEIRLSDSGDVININITRPSGNPAYDESVRKAIQMASPLMRNDPPDATFFQRYFADGVNIEFKF